MSFKIMYDDNMLDVIAALNEELEKEGIDAKFEFDEGEHDGFEICTLIKKE